MNKILAILMCCAVYAPTDGQRNAQNQSRVFGLASMRTALTTVGLFTAAVFALNVNSKDNTAVGSLQEEGSNQSHVVDDSIDSLCYPYGCFKKLICDEDMNNCLSWVYNPNPFNPFEIEKATLNGVCNAINYDPSTPVIVFSPARDNQKMVVSFDDRIYRNI